MDRRTPGIPGGLTKCTEGRVTRVIRAAAADVASGRTLGTPGGPFACTLMYTSPTQARGSDGTKVGSSREANTLSLVSRPSAWSRHQAKQQEA